MSKQFSNLKPISREQFEIIKNLDFPGPSGPRIRTTFTKNGRKIRIGIPFFMVVEGFTLDTLAKLLFFRLRLKENVDFFVDRDGYLTLKGNW